MNGQRQYAFKKLTGGPYGGIVGFGVTGAAVAIGAGVGAYVKGAGVGG